MHIDVRGRRTRIRLAGDPRSQPLVLLHGIGRTLNDWDEQFPRLSSQFRLIAIDLPGSGFSERSAQPTTLPVLARAVLDVLDEIGESRPVHLAGNSLGGAVAMQVAVLAPPRAASLTLVDSAGFGTRVALALRLMTVPRLGEVMTRRVTRASARMMERTSLADPALVTRTRIDRAIAVSRQPDTGAVMLETARELATMRGIKAQWRAELLDAVDAVGLPTLVVWGEADRVLPNSHLRAARAALRDAQTRLFPKVGHMPQIEVPDAFAELITTFVESRPGL
ncbi:alpha/beta fold hydrolase [Gordonia sp. TBRC 11910]|uniref:Alpha/beta fold hydrolase n=1 Tax=Gordonia asplenii TaxID=2725283 RepID=A0A848KW00_9ACTN|nr:alpha/beta fold hydrolase [Gordonia asplenii]